MRILALLLALSLSIDAYACPMADAAAFTAAAEQVKKTAGTQATFQVDGLSCGDCSQKVVAALQGITGVKAAAVDYQSGQALVAFDAARVQPAALLAAIQATGYTAREVKREG